MAKKENEQPQRSSKKRQQERTDSFTKPQGFTHGMVSDVDPHFQLEGSYSDAMNIRLTNSDGNTFTVENIEGNSLFVDLHAFPKDVPADQGGTVNYSTFRDRGPDGDDPFNNGLLDNRGSIVGHVSYQNQLLLMIVVASRYDRNFDFTPGAVNLANPTLNDVNRTIFLLVDFDNNFEVKKITDLRVCYSLKNEYPDLNMDLDRPVRIEHLIENDNISRIYWTDNKNQLRTLNIKQSKLNLLSIDSLDISPLISPSQVTLDQTIHGSLPVGAYQYTYKYISLNGGESTFSPLSNIYHVSDQSFGSSVNFGGGPQGNLGSQGFMLSINDIDQDFNYIELYSLFYDSLNSAPRVAIVAKRQIGDTNMTISHINWDNEIENGLEEVLIEQNTWDVCKDIAIKDNILFAANLRSKKNWISEKEWNVKVLRFKIKDGTDSRNLDAMLTTDDRSVKHYEDTGSGPVEIGHNLGTASEITGFKKDDVDNRCGYGQLLGEEDIVPNRRSVFSDATSVSHFKKLGIYLNPMWTTCLENQRWSPGNKVRTKTAFEYRFLSDRMTLGGESFNYASNGLGGCRVSFGIQEREADQTQNTNSSPFISATSSGASFKTDDVGHQKDDPAHPLYDNTGTTFQASMSLGGSYDPHASGDKRGYQRGEIYRFGVQVYDMNGAPGNVLWIGDMQMPEQHDVLRMIDTREAGNGKESASAFKYTPFRPTISGYSTSYNPLDMESNDSTLIISHKLTHDFRLSFIYGQAIPPIDVEWFTGRQGGSAAANTDGIEAYVNHNGKQQKHLPGDVGSALTSNEGRRKGFTRIWTQDDRDDYGPAFDNTHYLFDLYVNFEFIIPAKVCDKISGFRVVRAERKEDDKRIIQQGLLNQTLQYGHAKHGLEAGYGSTNFSREDNKAFDDDPVFINTLNHDNPTVVEQPEYNTYLNGYLGLAENSYLAFYDNNATDGMATEGGNMENKVFYWPEKGDAKHSNTPNAAHYSVPNQGVTYGTPDMKYAGGGHVGELFRKSAYFGSHDKRVRHHEIPTPNHTNFVYSERSSEALPVSGSIFTLDAPDSAFGIRPYVYREGDFLRIDSVLKVSNEQRYNTQATQPFSWNVDYPSNYWTFSEASWKLSAGSGIDGVVNGGGDPGDASGADDIIEHIPIVTGATLHEALNYSSRYDLDENYGALIGKYYCFDPYYGIGMEIDGGSFAAKNFNPGHGRVYNPALKHGYQLPLSAAKEIIDGEIVPNSFFKKSPRMKSGNVHGFSNNTLGYVRHHRNNPEVSRAFNEQYYVFDAVYKGLSAVDGDDLQNAYSGSNDGPFGPNEDKEWDANKQKKDITYDTMSTMQMGLRSILLEVNTKISEVRRNAANGDDTWFDSRPAAEEADRYYEEWFACPDLSIIYQQGNWEGNFAHNGTNGQQSTTPGPTTTAQTFTYARPPVSNSVVSNHMSMPGNASDSVTHETKDLPPVDLGKNSQGSRNYHPHKFLCSIVRRVIPYGGPSKQSIDSTRYISCGNFHPVKNTVNNNPAATDDRQGHLSKVFGGDTFVNLYSHQKTSTPYMKKSCARWQVFPVESYVNTDMRSGLALTNGDTEIGKTLNKAPYSNDWLYNAVYSQESNTKAGLVIDESQPDNLDLPYEISYSNTKILGQTGDSFRQFPINQFHNMEGLYGEINRIVNFKNEIYVLQDSAFSKLLVNPLSMLSDDAGNSLFTGTGETVENHIYISTKFGTKHKFSVAQSESSLYFIDSNFARLFKYDTEKLISLGDSLGQRNYLKDIIKDWSHTKILTSGFDESYYGNLDNNEKPTNDRDYFCDNHLKFLGIYSIFDFKNKELLITFHNSAWGDENSARQIFADPETNEAKGSTTNGQPIGKSETLAYSEAINSFISKYNVAPPQWLAGGNGSFLLCPENEISVSSIANLGSFQERPYNIYGSVDGGYGTRKYLRYKNYRCNPLRLWIWDKHDKDKKTNFFGRKDTLYRKYDVESPIDGNDYTAMVPVRTAQLKHAADESYIEKVINSDGGSAKVFDNSRVIMTPKSVSFSDVKFYTETSEEQQIVINKKWDFENTIEGFDWYDGSDTHNPSSTHPSVNFGQSTITVKATDTDACLRTPDKDQLLHLEGKYNYLIRVKLKRTSIPSSWQGEVYWKGYNPDTITTPATTYDYWSESGSRKQFAAEPDGIDSDFVIVQWDMRNVAEWNNSIIQQIRFDFGHSQNDWFEIDWIEIGGLSSTRHDDGVLKFPLRTEESVRRTRGTWAKIKYTAKTTDKFNIFAILAKYRNLFIK